MKILLNPEKFAIIKSKKIIRGAFTNIVDQNETTVIIEQKDIDKKDIIDIQKDYRLITFDGILPFSLTGFLAKVAKALADEKIPIFAVSAYSTDHILVHEKHIKKAEKTLRKLK